MFVAMYLQQFATLLMYPYINFSPCKVCCFLLQFAVSLFSLLIPFGVCCFLLQFAASILKFSVSFCSLLLPCSFCGSSLNFADFFYSLLLPSTVCCFLLCSLLLHLSWSTITGKICCKLICCNILRSAFTLLSFCFFFAISFHSLMVHLCSPLFSCAFSCYCFVFSLFLCAFSNFLIVFSLFLCAFSNFLIVFSFAFGSCPMPHFYLGMVSFFGVGGLPPPPILNRNQLLVKSAPGKKAQIWQIGELGLAAKRWRITLIVGPQPSTDSHTIKDVALRRWEFHRPGNGTHTYR